MDAGRMQPGRIGRTRRSRAIVAVVAGAAALGLIGVAGCGGGSSGSTGSTATTAASPLEGLSANAVLERTQKAAGAASSVRIAGQVTTGNQTITLDLRLKAGAGAAGTMGIAGGNVDLIVLDKTIYLKGNEAFYRGVVGDRWNAEIAKLIVGRYLKASTTDANFGSLSVFTDMRSFLGGLLTPQGAVTRVAGTPVGGVATVGLKGGKPGKEAILLVADAADPLPLRLAPVSSPTGDQVTFSEWNGAVELTAPPADQVLDVAALTS